MSTGVLLLHGSSGTPDFERARILEAEGYDVLAPKWFDGPISEIALESFPLDELAARNDRLAVMGMSRGAEAALLLGARDERVDVVIGLAPTTHVWGWIHEDESQSSPWTWQGESLPFVPIDPEWRADDDPPSYVDGYRHRLKVYAAEAEAARIPVERIRGDVLLVAGGDDKVWPSVEFAEAIAATRGDRGTKTVIAGAAGHRLLLPGEQPKSGGQRMARGGSDEADRQLGALAWPEIRRTLAG